MSSGAASESSHSMMEFIHNVSNVELMFAVAGLILVGLWIML